MFKKFLYVLAFFLILPVQSKADNLQAKAQIKEIASEVVERIPDGKKSVLKILSPEESGLPIDFLRKLSSDFELALLEASDFKINLANRLATEDLWAEAIEFGDADFEALYTASKSEIMLMIIPRATASGLEINVTAYNLVGQEAGKIIASSGSVVLALDLEKSLGINVNTVTSQMKQVLKHIEEAQTAGGIIAEPKTYAQYYHNAKVLQQRGDVDLAMNNYEKALEEGFLFVDPLLELLDLANSRYGEVGTQKYFENRLAEKLPNDLRDVGFIKLDIKNVEDIYTNEDLANLQAFSPTLAVWLAKKAIKQIADTASFDKRIYADDYYFMQSARIVRNSYNSSDFQTYFIDKNFGTELANIAGLEASLEKLNRFQYTVSLVDVRDLNSNQHIYIRDCEPFRLEIISSYNTRVSRASDRLGARPICEGIQYQKNGTEFFGKRIDGVYTRTFPQNDGFIVSSEIVTGETNDCPFHANMDRLIFAPMCKGTRYLAVTSLMITDNVDATKPILLRLAMGGGDAELVYRETDISVDGTYISKLSAPIAADYIEGTPFYVDHPNKWFFAPGILQSTIQSVDGWGDPSGYRALPVVFQIEYTDTFGKKQVVKNAMQTPNYTLEQFGHPDDLWWASGNNFALPTTKGNTFFQDWSISGQRLLASRDVSYLNSTRLVTDRSFWGPPPVEKTAPRAFTCAVNTAQSKIINVRNFTNLRQQAGLDGRVIGEVGLGEIVQIVNPGRYLRYDRCAAACNGTNETAIKQCIDSNDIWIEVNHNGRRGFLSRKFLE